MSRMGDLAATDVYSAFDVPLEQGTNVGWANRMGEILTARPQYDETVQYTTASPLVQITEGDIGRATEAALGGMTVTPKGIRAYHSSPHDFDKFDLAKIGTGEGAQAYGHGLYFAESPAVSGQGGQYWRQFTEHPQFKGNDAETLATIALKNSNADRAKALEYLHKDREGYWKANFPNQFEGAVALLKGDKPVGPRTYEVNINADPAHMLDWDKPLREQPKSAEQFADLIYRNPKPTGPYPTGKDLYAAIARKQVNADWGAPGALAESLASQQLREAGIPGIKYLDQGSRAAGTGSSNFVIFDPNIIDIMKKYGIAGAAPVGMGALAAQDRYEP